MTQVLGLPKFPVNLNCGRWEKSKRSNETLFGFNSK